MPVPSPTVDPVAVSEAYERLTHTGVEAPDNIAIVATDVTTWRAFVQRSLEKAITHQCYPPYTHEDTTEEATDDSNMLTVLIEHLTRLREGVSSGAHSLMHAPIEPNIVGDYAHDENASQLLFLSEELAFVAELARVRYLQFREIIAQA